MIPFVTMWRNDVYGQFCRSNFRGISLIMFLGRNNWRSKLTEDVNNYFAETKRALVNITRLGLRRHACSSTRRWRLLWCIPSHQRSQAHCIPAPSTQHNIMSTAMLTDAFCTDNENVIRIWYQDWRQTLQLGWLQADQVEIKEDTDIQCAISCLCLRIQRSHRGRHVQRMKLLHATTIDSSTINTIWEAWSFVQTCTAKDLCRSVLFKISIT